MAYQAVGFGSSHAPSTSVPGTGATKGGYSTVTKQQLAAIAPLAQPKPLLAAPKSLPQPKNQINLHSIMGALGHVKNAAKDVGNAIVGGVKSAVVKPVESLGDHVVAQAKYLGGSASTQAQRTQIIQNQQKAQAVVKSGNLNTQTKQMLDKYSGTPEGTIKTDALIANGANDKTIQKQVVTDHNANTQNTKQQLGEMAQIASLGIGGSKAAELVGNGVKDVAEKEAPSLIEKGVQAAKDTVGVGTSGAVGSAGGEIANNPKATPLSVAKAAGAGYAGAAAFGLGAKVAGKVVGKVIGTVGSKLGLNHDGSVAPKYTAVENPEELGGNAKPSPAPSPAPNPNQAKVQELNLKIQHLQTKDTNATVSPDLKGNSVVTHSPKIQAQVDRLNKQIDSLKQGSATTNVKPLPFGDEHSVAGTPKVATKGILADLPEVQKNDTTRQAIVNRKAAIANTQDTFHVAQQNKLWDQLDTHDRSMVEKVESTRQMSPKFASARIDRIAKGDPNAFGGKGIEGAHNPKVFAAYVHGHQQDMATLLEHRQALHPETGKIQNYIPHFFDRTDEKTAAKLNEIEANQPKKFAAGQHPSYVHQRVIPTYAKAEQLGLKRQNANVHEDYLQAVRQSAQENGHAALVKGLVEAHGLHSLSNKVGFEATTGKTFDRLQIPGGKGLTMPQKLADFYNSRAPSKLSTTAKEDLTKTQKLRTGYKTVNKAGKNVVLAGGLFHGLRTGITTAGHQLFNLKNNLTHPVSAIGDNLRLVASTLDPTGKLHDARLKQLSEDGGNNVDGKDTITRARAANLSYTSRSIQGDLASKKEEAGINSIPVLKQAHEAVFSRQIPQAKLMMFHQLTRNLDTRVPGDMVKMRQIAAGINRGLGGIDNAVDGLPPKVASAVDNVILGRDLNEGIVSTLGHAIKPNSTDGRVARQFVAGSAVVSALPGLAALAAQGKLSSNGKLDEGKIGKAMMAELEDPQIPTPWRNPPSKTQPNGTPISLHLPTTFVSILSKAIKPALDPTETFSGSRLEGVESEATGRLAFVPAVAEKLKNNQDFYGNPIYGKDKNGNPISPETAGKNIALQAAPIPAAQISNVASGKTNKTEALLNEAGLRGSTSTLPSSELNHAAAVNAFFNTKTAVSKAQSAAKKQADALVTAGKPNQAARVKAEFNASLPKLVNGFRGKYAQNYNPAWDKAFESYLLSTTSRSSAMSAADVKLTQQEESTGG